MTVFAAGEPGHGLGTVLRLQPPPIVPGQADGGQADMFEIICTDCGDDPGLGYFEVSSRLQAIRGPRPAEAALAEFNKHLGWAG
jgi:hypothetical protein